MRFNAEIREDALWIRFEPGKLEADTARKLVLDLEQLLTDEIKSLVLDLEQVTDISSGALAILKKIETEYKDRFSLGLIGPKDPIFSEGALRKVFGEVLPEFEWV
jgi:anti-anti-sigma regulatory factor